MFDDTFIYTGYGYNGRKWLNQISKLYSNLFFDTNKTPEEIHYEAKLFTKQAHNFMPLCSWIPETSLKICYNFVGSIKENERTKEEQRERPCCGIRLQFTNCTDWPRNV